MARLVVVVVALLVVRNVSAECFDENGLPKNESVCIPGHWNIARDKSATITATSTCGNPSATACRLKPLNGCTKCNSSDPKLSHPARYIVDKENVDPPVTYWQSDTWWTWRQNGNTKDLQVNITLNFNKSFDATGLLTLTFDSLRPFGMILEKSSDSGKTWKVLQYYASNCKNRYQMESTDPTISRRSKFDAYCTETYSKFQPQQNGQVLFDFKTRYEEEAEFFNKDVQEYLFVTNFRFRLEYPGTDGLEVGDKSQDILQKLYYAISDLTIIGRCRCNGHAAHCEYNTSIYGHNKCVNCKHFTDGIDCEKCLPLYNNRTWMPATAKNKPNPCQKCECHEHADSCVFNKTFNYGICQDCKHNTAGHFCQDCKDKFYRNVSLPQNNSEVCLACGCFRQGILNNGSCNITTGQCVCRQYVTGRQCNRCVDTYYGYDVEPLGHCKACNCLRTGTKDGNLNCHQTTGQCTCKNNTDQLTCSRCKDGFYNFPKKISDDCLECDCDYGGSSSGLCNKINGTCECRKHIEGTRCTGVPPGYFTGSFTYFKMEAEQSEGEYQYTANTEDLNKYFTGTGYAKITPGQHIAFKTKNNYDTFNGYILLRYTDASHGSIPLQIKVTAPGTLTCSGISKTISVSGLVKGKGQAWLSKLDSITVCKGQELTFNVSYGNGAARNASIEIDSLIFYPEIKDTRIYKIADRDGNAHGFNVSTIVGCWNNSATLAAASQSQSICKNISFSAMAQVLDGALPCGCNSTGSVSNATCDRYGGQCQCKPGVTGRTCDRCMPGYYNFNSNGCTACNCSSIGSHHLVCDAVTGQCPCKPGVVNRTCDRCNHTYYGFNTGNGCVDCKCNASGSADLQCDSVTGVCPCKNSTDGDKCDKCGFGYYNYTTDGCQACHCDKDGSSTLQCHLQTGRCDCKSNVQGFKCNDCKPGFYNRDSINPSGCSPCFCYGRSNTCTSAKGYVKSYIESVPTTSTWQPDRDGFDKIEKNSKSTTFKYTGNKTGSLLIPEFSKKVLLSSYAQLFTFELKFLSVESSNVNLSVLFEPKNIEFKLSPKASVNVTKYHVVLHETTSVKAVTAREIQESLAHTLNVKLKIVFLSSGSMEISSARLGTSKEGNVGEHAGNVENCTCSKTNYTGLSCQFCSQGYTRNPKQKESDPFRFSTRCELCSCTNRSKNCNGETGKCKDCSTGSEGYYCETCQAGVDNTTDCDKCFDGYYGLYLKDKMFNGCGKCNCILPNTLYGNQSICAKADGQCNCKANISGRICDRCHENAYNNSQGHCIDCPVCYSLLQVFVHELRDNISSVEASIYNLRNGGTGDTTFEKSLETAQKNVRSLVEKATNSSDIEKDLHKELLNLNQTLDNMEALLRNNLTTGVSSLEGVVSEASRDKNRTEELIKLTEKMVSDAYRLINSSIKVLVNQTNQSNEYLKQRIPIFNTYEKQALDFSTEQNRTGKGIIGNTNSARLLVQEANSTSLRTVVDHEKNSAVIRQLQLECETVKNLGFQTNSTAALLLKNSTIVLRNAKKASESVNALNPSNPAELQQILNTSKSLTDKVTAALATIQKNNNEYKTLRESVETSLKQTAVLMTKVETISQDATSVLNEARRAEAEAKAAVALAEKTHEDAKEMLQILQNFANKANESQQLAATSLEKSKQANQTSQEAIANSQRINASIQAALLIANQGLSIATTAKGLANKEHQDVSNVYSQATTLKSDTDSTKHTPENFNSIKANVSSINTQIQPPIKACKENYTSYAADAKQKSTKALSDAIKASTAINNANEGVESINKEFNKLQQVNATRLRELQLKIKQLRATFDKENVSALNRNLQAAKEEQQKFIDKYKKDVIDLKRQVNEMKELRKSLKDTSYRGGCT